MCGFFVVLQRGQAPDQSRFQAGLERIQHRGPDYSGSVTRRWYEPQFERTIHSCWGHNRLSIIDLDPRSHQPFERHDHLLVYNGEIYNYRELRSQLDPANRYQTQGDTEVLCELLAQRGIDGLKGANGMWAFCFYDHRSHTLIAARDRYGKKPLFFYKDQQVACFASEISPILHYLQMRPEVDLSQIDAYLMEGMLFPSAGSDTYLKSIHQVPTGQVLELDLSSWTLDLDHSPALALHSDVEAPADAVALKEILADAVRARLVSDRNIGLLLSGGIDSSLILSILYALDLQDAVHCFIGDTGTSDDADYARQCVDQLGIPSRTLHVDYGSATFDRFLRICRAQEKPFPLVGNAMAMAEMYGLVAEHDMTVVLDGTGGDEIFGGYWDRYYESAVHSALRLNDHGWLDESEHYTYQDGGYSASQVIARAKLQTAVKAPPTTQRQHLRIAEFIDSEILETPSRDPLWDFEGDFTDALLIDSTQGRLNEWIWQNDRNAMMSSIENRSPLLDYRLFPFISTGYSAKFHRQYNKYELRSIFDAFQPLPTQWRTQKQGFRWVAGNFFEQNSGRILELIDASRILRSRVAVDRYLEKARQDRQYLLSDATSRMLCIAGLEQTLELQAA